jgi:glutathione S-transferase
MTDVTLFGFPRSVYVQMAGIVLTHKEVPYAFHDLETEMNTPSHLALHPFERVPILRHGDFVVYETAAIVGYVDDAFDGPKLAPADPRQRARMNQWISAINGYYYPTSSTTCRMSATYSRSSGFPLTRRSWRTQCQRSRSVSRSWNASFRTEAVSTGPELSLADIYMLPITMPSASRPKRRPCTPLPVDPCLA